MRVAVLGAAGLMGSAVARDLRASEEIVALDRRSADGVAAVDAEDRQALMLALDGCDLLVNAASPRVNLAAMDAALAAGCAYLDLGGPYPVASRQYALDEAFAERGLLALPGCGAGPGITNVMAVRAARDLDEVKVIRCASAQLDEAGPSLPCSREVLLDELREPPMIVRGGQHVPVEPRSPGGEVAFPGPIGPRDTLFTAGSEALMLGETLGATDVHVRVGLDPEVVAALDSERDLPPASARTWSGQVVEVLGTRAGEPATVTMTALTGPDEEAALGGTVVSAAAVAAAAARLYGRGALAGRAGVLPPETALDPDELFPELEARGCQFTIDTTSEVQA